MDTDIATPTTISHGFMPYFAVDTDADGGNPRLDDIDFSDSQVDSVIKYHGDFVDDNHPARVVAGEFLDGCYRQMIEACRAIAEGKSVVILDANPIETDRNDSGSDCPGVLVWFDEGQEAAAVKFTSDLDKLAYPR